VRPDHFRSYNAEHEDQAGPRGRFALWRCCERVALVLLLAALLAARVGADTATAADAPVWYDYEVVNSFPHDRRAFTQGLLYDAGYLYESTGLYGQSELRQVELATGRVLRLRRLAADQFGEGLTIWGDQLIQLTWRNQTGFVYDRRTFRRLTTFSYPGEGWGLTHDGHRLIMSDGTADLRFLDPGTFTEVGRTTVTEQGAPVEHLNELVMVNGRLFANVWQTDQIAIIDLDSGRVTGRIDLQDLLSPAEREGADVLNGIAWDAEQERLFVTGKFWPRLFEIRIHPRADGTAAPPDPQGLPR